MRRTLAFLVGLIAGLVLVACGSASTAEEVATDTDDLFGHHPVTKESLGALIFADTNLSEPRGQACASCHDPKHGWADPRGHATSQGAVRGRYGIRNAPTIAYASFTPELLPSGDEVGYAGGFFWDGRVSTLQEQAKGPLLNPLEMNNPDAATILRKIKASRYASHFVTIYGPNALDDADVALDHLVDAIAAFETSSIPNRFTSKYDAYLEGHAHLSAAETRGLTLFESKKTGPCSGDHDRPPCGCAQCHLDQKRDDGSPPLFTDFGFDNIGIPFNAANPFYRLPAPLNPGGPTFIDNGVGVIVHNPRQFGHFKAPTLRNVALTAPYGHNGYFEDLKAVVHFYNTRDVRNEWPAPEQTYGLNLNGLGNLGLTGAEEDDLVSFLGTLTDGYSTN